VGGADSNEGMRQIVVTPEHWPVIESWLNRQGWVLAQIPPELCSEDDLPTWVIHPKPGR
jgi:hypothetical protein